MVINENVTNSVGNVDNIYNIKYVLKQVSNL